MAHRMIMKHCVPLFVSVLVIMMCTSSCTSLRVEKRKYRDGYYFGGGSNQNIVNTDSVVHIMNSVSESRGESGQMLPDSTVNVIDTISHATESPLIVSSDSFSTVHVAKESVTNQGKPMDIQQSHEIPEPEVVPEEARRLNTWWWISLGMLVLGVIASIVAFMPFVGAGFGVLIASAPFLVLGALGIGIWVMIAARRRKAAAGSAELSKYYDKLRKRARLIVILASSVIVVFVLFLALIIAALSTFQ